MPTADVATIRAKFEGLRPYLDERRRRLWAATEALALGRGGVTVVAAATGLRRNTIRAGLGELRAGGSALPDQRVRAPGGGRKARAAGDPTLLRDLEALVEPVTRGDPMSPLRWTCKSTRQLAAELSGRGHPVSHQTVAELLRALWWEQPVQPAGQPQDQGGCRTPRPRRPIRLHQRPDRGVPGAGPAGDLGGHEEEGTGRRVQEWRSGVAADRAARGGAGLRLCRPGPGPGHPLRRVRPGRQPGVGQRRHRPRHAGLRRADGATLVGADGAPDLPRGHRAADHRRRWGQQRQPRPPLEDRTAAAG